MYSICTEYKYTACINTYVYVYWSIYNSIIFQLSWNFPKIHCPIEVLPLYLVTSFLHDSSSSTVLVPVLGSWFPSPGCTSRCRGRGREAHVAAPEFHNHVAPPGDQLWNHHGHQYNWTKSLAPNKLQVEVEDVEVLPVTHGGQDFQ